MMQLGRTRVVIARLYFSGTDSVGAPAPSCGGGQGGGSRGPRRLANAPLLSSRADQRDPPPRSSPTRGEEARRDDPRVNLKAEGSNTREMAKTWRKHCGSG